MTGSWVDGWVFGRTPGTRPGCLDMQVRGWVLRAPPGQDWDATAHGPGALDGEGQSTRLAPQDLPVSGCGGVSERTLSGCPLPSLAPPRGGPTSDQPGSGGSGGSPCPGEQPQATVPLSPPAPGWIPRFRSELQQKQTNRCQGCFASPGTSSLRFVCLGVFIRLQF